MIDRYEHLLYVMTTCYADSESLIFSIRDISQDRQTMKNPVLDFGLLSTLQFGIRHLWGKLQFGLTSVNVLLLLLLDIAPFPLY